MPLPAKAPFRYGLCFYDRGVAPGDYQILSPRSSETLALVRGPFDLSILGPCVCVCVCARCRIG